MTTNGRFFLVALELVFSCASITACGGAATIVAPADDAGSGDDASPASSQDASDGGTSPVDAPAGDAAPSKTLLASGADIHLIGVTSDDLVVYQQGTSVFAVPIAGGAPAAILQGTPGPTFVSGKVVYAFGAAAATCADQQSLAVWTAAHGAVTIASNVDASFLPSVSPDGARIAYPERDATCAWQPVRVANVDGSGTPMPLVGGASCPGSTAATSVSFTHAGALVTTGSSCAGDAQVTSQIDIFAGASLSHVASLAGGVPLVDPTGSWLWVRSSDGGAELVRASDGTALFTTAAGSFADFDATGANVYFVSNGALEALPTSAPSTATVLVPSGVLRPWRVAPNSQALVDIEQAPADDAGTVSFSAYLRGVAPGAHATRVGASTEVSSQPFTADGAYLVITSGGSLEAYATGASAASPGPTEVATGIQRFVALRRAELLAVAVDGSGVVVDASGSAAPSTFTPAVSGMLGARGGADIVYTTTAAPAGLYVVASP